MVSIKARSRAEQERSIFSAWWQARIARDERLEPISHYLDELLSDEERSQKAEEQFFAKFDRQLGTGEVTMQ